MLINGKPIDQLTADDLLRHQTEQIREGRTLDYKETLPRRTAEDAREWATDVASFANTVGGYLLYGVQATDDLATGFPGLPGANLDDEILRLDAILRTNVNPRIPQPHFQRVDMPTGGPVLVVGVERSWRLPHMVEGRIHGRGAKGKYALDMTEVRAAVLGTESLRTGLTSWRAERLARVMADDAGVPLNTGGKLVLHILPLSATAPGQQVDLHRVKDRWELFRPFRMSGSLKFCIDGLIERDEPDGSGRSGGYVLLYRDGRVEAVDATATDAPPGCRPGLGSQAFERDVIEQVKRTSTLFVEVGVDWPVLVMLSLVDVRTHTILGSPGRGYPPFGRDVIAIPEVIWERREDDVPAVMRPAFDVVWNGVGVARSPNYDSEGRWVG